MCESPRQTGKENEHPERIGVTDVMLCAGIEAMRKTEWAQEENFDPKSDDEAQIVTAVFLAMCRAKWESAGG